MVQAGRKRPSDASTESPSRSREGSPMKRVKLEKFAAAQRRQSRSVSVASQDQEDEDMSGKEGEEDESDDEEGSDAASEHFSDDEENMRIYQEAKERKTRMAQAMKTESGYIKHIQLVDFMCHQNLSVQFSPKMNAIVGHNGSGKSAVLTAIAVALGGKAAVTGRGSGIKDLIRRDADKAIITLTLANGGTDGYQQHIYNPDIVIERTITKTSSTYKIRASREGKIIATKKDDLSQITNFFNLHVDSPLTILTQDQARTFLANADEALLYKFFLNGTGLQALYLQYNEIGKNIDQLENLIERSRELLPDMKAKLVSLDQRLRATEKISEQKVKLHHCKIELAWAYVAKAEKDRDESYAKVEEIREKIEKSEAELHRLQEELAPVGEQIQLLQQGMAELEASRKPLESARRRAEGKAKELKLECQDMSDNIANLTREVAGHKDDLRNIERKIVEKTAALTAGRTAQQIKDEDDLAKFEEKLQRLELDQPAKERIIDDQIKIRDAAQDELDAARDRLSEADGQINRANNDLTQLRRSQGDPLAPYGHNVRAVLDVIDHTQWNGRKPVGPLGLYVKLSEGDFLYRNVLQAQLGPVLCTWACDDDRDVRKLMGILAYCQKEKHYNMPGRGGYPAVIRDKDDMFDYSHGDLSQRGKTILSALRFEGQHAEYVKRLIITRFNIEKIFLSPDNVSANGLVDHLTAQTPRQPINVWTADGFSAEGTGSSRGSNPIGANWQGHSLFTRDVAEDIRYAEDNVARLRQNRDVLSDEMKVASEALRIASDELAKTRRSLEQLRGLMPKMITRIDEIKERLALQPADELGGLEANKREKNSDIISIEGQINALKEGKEELQGRIDRNQVELEKFLTELEEFAPKRRKQQEDFQIASTARARLSGSIDHHQRATTETYPARLRDAQSAWDKLNAVVLDHAEKAARFHPDRPETIRKVDTLIAEQAAIQKAINAAVKAHGDDPADLTALRNTAKENLASQEKSVKQLGALSKVAKAALTMRQHWWEQKKVGEAVAIKCAFITNLDKRGFNGRLFFDHNRSTLTVKIQTTGSVEDAGSALDHPTRSMYKTPQNLSGGEKSFTTVSLLLALWENVTSPLSCLDEWDVFLDNVNRKMAGGMLVDGARQSDGKQYILITPLGMDGINVGAPPDNRVIMMKDPIRGQTTLPFVPETAAAA